MPVCLARATGERPGGTEQFFDHLVLEFFGVALQVSSRLSRPPGRSSKRGDNFPDTGGLCSTCWPFAPWRHLLSSNVFERSFKLFEHSDSILMLRALRGRNENDNPIRISKSPESLH